MAYKEQFNFLLNEGSGDRARKGANSVISMVHHIVVNQLKRRSNVKHLSAHADNCGGQNKNKTMTKFLAFLVETGLYESVELNFMVAGHTKFIVDQNFGLLVFTLEDMINVVESSCRSGINKAVLDTEVTFRRWDDYLESCFETFVKDIRKVHCIKVFKQQNNLRFEARRHPNNLEPCQAGGILLKRPRSEIGVESLNDYEISMTSLGTARIQYLKKHFEEYFVGKRDEFKFFLPELNDLPVVFEEVEEELEEDRNSAETRVVSIIKNGLRGMQVAQLKDVAKARLFLKNQLSDSKSSLEEAIIHRIQVLISDDDARLARIKKFLTSWSAKKLKEEVAKHQIRESCEKGH